MITFEPETKLGKWLCKKGWHWWYWYDDGFFEPGKRCVRCGKFKDSLHLY